MESKTKTKTDLWPLFVDHRPPDVHNRCPDSDLGAPHCQKHCVHIICLLMMQTVDHEDFLAYVCVCNPEDLAKMPKRPELSPENFVIAEIEPWITEVEGRNAADEHSKYDEKILQLFYKDVAEIMDYLEAGMRATTPENDNFLNQLVGKYETQAEDKRTKAIDDFVREMDYFFLRGFYNRNYLTISIQSLLNIMKHLVKNIINDWAKEESASSFRDIHREQFKNFPKADQSASAALCHFWKSRMERLIGLLAWRDNAILEYQSS